MKFVVLVLLFEGVGAFSTRPKAASPKPLGLATRTPRFDTALPSSAPEASTASPEDGPLGRLPIHGVARSSAAGAGLRSREGTFSKLRSACERGGKRTIQKSVSVASKFRDNLALKQRSFSLFASFAMRPVAVKGSAYPAPTSSGAAVPRGLGVLRATASLEETPVEEKEEEQVKKNEVTKKAMRNFSFVLLAAALFDAGIYYFMGPGPAIDFVSGFLVEESLSVDNLFVFLLLFDYFKVPASAQERVLKWGVIGAVALRGLFIGIGYGLLHHFKPVLLLFSAILIGSSVKLLASGDDDGDESMEDSSVVKFAQKMIPTTAAYDGDRFFTEVEEGGKIVKKATPLLLCLACVEISDIVFAVDSVPAVFGVTDNPFIVFTSNMFSIMGLRCVYLAL